MVDSFQRDAAANVAQICYNLADKQIEKNAQVVGYPARHWASAHLSGVSRSRQLTVFGGIAEDTERGPLPSLEVDMSVESPKYEVLKHDGSFELRRYAGYLTANVRVTAGDWGHAMKSGFNPLADYIFGNNHASDRISMTAPVTAGRACCQKIAMTAPVTAQQTEDEYVVSFTMPSAYSRDNLPRPNNAAVSIESVDSHLAAVAEFGGYFSKTKADRAESELRSWLADQGLTAAGEPIVAQYDPPWKPGFARRNEIMIVVE